MKMLHKIVFMVVLLLMEAIIMLYIVPKANEDEINMRIWIVVDLALALLISLAILIKENRGERKSVVRLFLICVIPYLQVGYTSAFYEWSAVCLTLPIFQILFGYAIFKLYHNITTLHRYWYAVQIFCFQRYGPIRCGVFYGLRTYPTTLKLWLSHLCMQ